MQIRQLALVACALALVPAARSQNQVTIHSTSWSGSDIIVEAYVEGSGEVTVEEIQFQDAGGNTLNPPASIDEVYSGGTQHFAAWQVTPPAGTARVRVKYKYNGVSYHTTWLPVPWPPPDGG